MAFKASLTHLSSHLYSQHSNQTASLSGPHTWSFSHLHSFALIPPLTENISSVMVHQRVNMTGLRDAKEYQIAGKALHMCGSGRVFLEEIIF